MGGDVEKGAKIFKRSCEQCHSITIGGAQKVGPNLHGIFGKKSGTVPGYNYSDANKTAGVTWTEDTMNAFISDPKKFMPGNKMIFAGLKKEKELGDLIAYMKQASTS